jgi:hypothetical protein
MVWIAYLSQKMKKLGCQGCGLVELVKVSIVYTKGPQFKSWCGLKENNSDRNSDLLEPNVMNIGLQLK